MIVAYYVLHYGSDYLGSSIRSIYDHVDKILCLYSPAPCFGHNTELVNPDTKEKLQQALREVSDPANKINWYERQGASEGAQRDSAVEACRQMGAKQVLIVDADEVWDASVLRNFINKMKEHPNTREFRIRMSTLWRSFNMVCFDNMLPTRGINLAGTHGTYHYPEGRVWHFGYAREVQHIEYKMSIHGHKDEIRPGWLERFKKWPEGGNLDLHPTCVNMWNAEPLNRIFLPLLMTDHPYWDRSVI